MTISLQHNAAVLHQPVAAFVRGNSIIEWLTEISRWNVDAGKLSFYVLPTSVQLPAPAGLFVIINNTIEANKLNDAYGLLAERLYVPVHASVYPYCSPAELKEILMWDVQVFHPTIGLVGFDKEDALSLEQLFNYTNPVAMQWDFAHPGVPLRPALMQVQVSQPTQQEVLDSIKKDIDAQPLKDIPGAKEGKLPAIEKVTDTIKYGMLKALYSLINGAVFLGNVLPAGNSNRLQNGNASGTPSSGMFAQWQNWLEKNMEMLEKRQQDELQRLMKMFEENPELALQYAIPLDSKYLDRGKTKPSSSLLTWRSTIFNIKDLGGRSNVNRWDIGDRYFDLRTKYLTSAKALMAKGNYKKAAYVYAHLLADYTSAANALVQGKHYREAAVLYKDHLHNTKAAAECLENGGLIIESIELYKEMNETEKVGDLYRHLEQQEPSNRYFKLTIAKYLATGNQLEAARILHEKMKEDARAKQILLDGWNNNHHAESCLKRYFDIVAITAEGKLKEDVEKIYKDTDEKDGQLLNVLLHVKQYYADEELANRTTDIAYEIMSKKAVNNDHSLLTQLKQFVPGDKLLAPDVSRYIQKRPKNRLNEQQPLLKLDPDVKWMDATWYRNQLLVVGTKGQKLQLARCNWYANIEYTTWPNDITKGEKLWIISNPVQTNQIIITGSKKFRATTVQIHKNKYFEDVIEIIDPVWLPTNHIGFALTNVGVSFLEANNGSATLHNYTQDGLLKNSVICKPAKEEFVFHDSNNHQSLIKCGVEYYKLFGNTIVAIDEKGAYAHYTLHSGLRMFAVVKQQKGTLVLVSTNAGCHMLHYLNGAFEERVDLFAEEKIPTNISFLTSTAFALVQKSSVEIYSINEKTISTLRTIQTETNIISVIPAYTNQKFALVEETGAVSVHEHG